MLKNNSLLQIFMNRLLFRELTSFIECSFVGIVSHQFGVEASTPYTIHTDVCLGVNAPEVPTFGDGFVVMARIHELLNNDEISVVLAEETIM